MAERKLTLRKMSEKGFFPGPIPHQLAFLAEQLIYYFDPIKDLEVATINGREAEVAQNKCYARYSRLRATTYRTYANYAGEKDRERFLRKAIAAEKLADLIEK